MIGYILYDIDTAYSTAAQVSHLDVDFPGEETPYAPAFGLTLTSAARRQPIVATTSKTMTASGEPLVVTLSTKGFKVHRR